MCPSPGEPCDQFVARLHQQAQFCEFQDLEDQLRDQLVEKIGPTALRRKLLEQVNIKLKIVRAREAANDQLGQMQQDGSSSNTASGTTVNAVASRSRRSRSANVTRMSGHDQPNRVSPECKNCMWSTWTQSV